MSVLNRQQAQVLYNATRIISAIYKAKAVAAESGIPEEGWDFWQNALILNNAVGRMVLGKEPPGWRYIALVCALASDFISALPADHNVHTLAPVAVLAEIEVLAKLRSVA